MKRNFGRHVYASVQFIIIIAVEGRGTIVLHKSFQKWVGAEGWFFFRKGIQSR